jgi:hypothetical protein
MKGTEPCTTIQSAIVAGKTWPVKTTALGAAPQADADGMRQLMHFPLILQAKIPFHPIGGRDYLLSMTKLFERALEAVRRLPPDAQDEIARAMLQLAATDGEPEEIDAAHLPAMLEGLAQAKRREFASDAEVEASFRRFDR